MLSELIFPDRIYEFVPKGVLLLFHDMWTTVHPQPVFLKNSWLTTVHT